MIHTPKPLITFQTRRRFLQGSRRHRTAAAPTRGPSGQMTWAIHVQIAPTWFDPAEIPGICTPVMIRYALHDALMQPRPEHPMAPNLATAWHESPDGLPYG
jgi:peptide/nickel transport system substrate-binding protein